MEDSQKNPIAMRHAIVASLIGTIFSMTHPATLDDRFEAPIQTKQAEVSIEDMITEMADEYGVNVSTAMRIAECESKLNPLAKNTRSTASGVYQFLDGTWNAYCSGDVFDPVDNITCFMEQYQKNPQWWECK